MFRQYFTVICQVTSKIGIMHLFLASNSTIERLRLDFGEALKMEKERLLLQFQLKL